MKKKWSIIAIALALVLAMAATFGCTPGEEAPPPEPEDVVPATLVGPAEELLASPALLLFPIDFAGSDWKPGELITIEMVLPEGLDMPTVEPGQDAIGIAAATADANGNFETSVEPSTKLNFFLRCDWQPNMLPDIETMNPLPPGTYTVRATGLSSGKVATTTMLFVLPE